MAAKEMYDYLSTVSPDTTTTLSVSPQQVLVETAEFYQKVHEFDDNTERVITLDSTPVFNVRLRWPYISESDAGTIIDFFLNATLGNGQARSFQWSHPTDGHTYVTKFRGKLPRSVYHSDIHGVTDVVLRVMGNA